MPRNTNKPLTQKRLRELLDYAPDTGLFAWRTSRKGQPAKGTIAGTVSGEGYLAVTIDYKTYLLHRLAWFYVHGVWPDDKLDHANGIRTDNRITNIRECNQQENARNRKTNKGSISGVSGVTWRRGKWEVNISVRKYCNTCFGRYSDLELAELVAHEARNKYHKEFSVCAR